MMENKRLAGKIDSTEAYSPGTTHLAEETTAKQEPLWLSLSGQH